LYSGERKEENFVYFFKVSFFAVIYPFQYNVSIITSRWLPSSVRSLFRMKTKGNSRFMRMRLPNQGEICDAIIGMVYWRLRLPSILTLHWAVSFYKHNLYTHRNPFSWEVRVNRTFPPVPNVVLVLADL
jgi:hypothetical protein